MRVEYNPQTRFHNYVVNLCAVNEYAFFAYPSFRDNGLSVLSLVLGELCECADPPSAELCSLIEVGAPWYAVMDKLSEEYPQWQHHFDEAIRRHQAEQTAGEPQPQEERA